MGLDCKTEYNSLSKDIEKQALNKVQGQFGSMWLYPDSFIFILNNSLLYRCHILLTHSLVKTLRLFLLLAIMSNSAADIHIHVFCKQLSSIGITGSYSNSCLTV